MEANVQSGLVVTRAKSDKPKETLWHKGLGSRIMKFRMDNILRMLHRFQIKSQREEYKSEAKWMVNKKAKLGNNQHPSTDDQKIRDMILMTAKKYRNLKPNESRLVKNFKNRHQNRE